MFVTLVKREEINFILAPINFSFSRLFYVVFLWPLDQ